MRFPFKRMGAFCNGLAIVCSDDDKEGMIDTTGKWIIPPVYDNIEYAGGKFALVKLGATHNDNSFFISGKCGVVDLNNNVVLPIEYESADCLISKNCDCWRIKNTAGLCGVVNLRTGEVIPCKYDYLSSYCKGYLSAEMNGKWGLISLQDEIILPFIFNEIGYSLNTVLDWIPVKLGDRWFYMDCHGQRQFVGKMVISRAFPFNKKGMAEVEVKDECSSGWGIIDTTGKFIIPPIYLGVYESHDVFVVNGGGFCCGGDYCDEDEATYEEDVYGLVDVNNRLLIPIMYDDMTYLKDDYWIVYKDWKYGVINQRNEIMLPIEYDCLSEYNENSKWLTARKDGKCEVITLTGEVVPPDVYESVFPPVKREPDWHVERCDGREFYVDSNGRKVFGEEVNFIHAAPFVDGTAFVEAKYEAPYLKHGLIDTTGKYIIPPIYDHVFSIGRDEYKAKGFIIVNIGFQLSNSEYEDRGDYYRKAGDEDGKWGVIDLNNRTLISIKYTSLYYAKDDCFTAELDGKWGVVNLREEIVLPFEYEYLGYRDDWGLEAKKDGKYGVITLEGEIVLPFVYDSIDLPFANWDNMDLIPVKYEGEAFYIDRTGKRVLL